MRENKREIQAFTEYLEKKEFYHIEQLRGAVLIFVFLFAFLTTPVTLMKESVYPYAILVLVSIIHYGIIYKRLSVMAAKNKALIKPFKYFQSIINLILITVLVHLTGGIESYFTIIYVFDIITSGFLLSWRESFQVSSMGWIFYLLMLYLEKLGVIDHISVWPYMENLYKDPGYIFGYTFKLMMMMYVSSFIAGYINNYIMKNTETITKMLRFISKVSSSFGEMVTIDPVTNLYNLNYLKLRLAEEVNKAKSFERQLALIYFGINDFDAMTDQYGIGFMNGALKEIGKNINYFAGRHDVLCRVSGAEFVILAADTKESDVLARIEKIKEKLETIEVRTKDGQYTTFNATFGWVTYPQDAQNTEIFLERARQALQIAENTNSGMIYRYKGVFDNN